MNKQVLFVLAKQELGTGVCVFIYIYCWNILEAKQQIIITIMVLRHQETLSLRCLVLPSGYDIDVYCWNILEAKQGIIITIMILRHQETLSLRCLFSYLARGF